jgi:hypothetical protein
MWMPNKNEGESGGKPLTETQPGLLVVFRHVYRFILQAVNCDKTTADTIFEDYLAGKLSEELLAISRACVTSDQASSCKRQIEKRDWVEQRQLTAERGRRRR